MITLPEKLSTMTPYEPSEDIYQIKLDANESYFSLPEELRDAIAASIDTSDFNRYPDPSVKDVRRLAGREYRIAPDNIVVGNGSDELISLIMHTFAPQGGKVMVLSPDFSMYFVMYFAASATSSCVAISLKSFLPKCLRR